MKHKLLTLFVAVLLIAAIPLGLLSGCLPTISPAPTEPAPTEPPAPSFNYPKGPEDIVFRFAITSDVHLRTVSGYDFYSYEILQQLYKTAYDYAGTQPYDKLDGIFVAGDFTQYGSEKAFTKYFDFVNANTQPGTISLSCLGNHEYSDVGGYSPECNTQLHERYLRTSGYDAPDQHVVINGYHVIMLSTDQYEIGTKFSQPKYDWLEAELAKAAADDPTGTKPIIVFSHFSPSGTVNSSASENILGTIYSKYPQVVAFGGHSHRSVMETTSIWQGNYTVINTGSLCYMATVIKGHPSFDSKEGVQPLGYEGQWHSHSDPSGTRSANLYNIVEINSKNEIRLVVINLFTEEVLRTIELGAVGDPSAFTHNAAGMAAMEEASQAPVWGENAALTVTEVTEKGFTLTVPQASCDAFVNNYRCEIYKGDTLVRTEYRLACQFLGSMTPELVPISTEKLQPGTEYSVKVIPVSYWGKEGTPLTTTITTAS